MKNTTPIKNIQELSLMFEKLKSYEAVTIQELLSFQHLKVSFMKMLEESLPRHSSEESLYNNIKQINEHLYKLNQGSTWRSKLDRSVIIPLTNTSNYVDFQYYNELKRQYTQMYVMLYGEGDWCGYNTVYTFEEVQEGFIQNASPSKSELIILNEEAKDKINKYLNSKVKLW